MPFNPVTKLFEPFDPQQQVGQQQGPQIPQLPQQESDSLLQSLTGKAMSGLGYVGSVLDKTFGGRAIRGLLGGKPEEALSLLPFSDTLGITDEKNRVSGEDLAKQWGLLEGEGEKGTFEMRDLLGPALEMGLDPASYLGLGSLTAAGREAKMGSTLGKTLAGRIGSGQAGLAGFGAPWFLPGVSKDPLFHLGTGGTGQSIAQGLGGVSDWIGSTRPALAAKALFSNEVNLGGKPAITAIGQQTARDINAAKPAARAEAISPLLEQNMQLAGAGQLAGDIGQDIRGMGENTFVGPLTQEKQNAFRTAQDLMEAGHREAIGLGTPMGTFESHFPGSRPLDSITQPPVQAISLPPIGGGSPPREGFVVANRGPDGKIYYGKPGQTHYDIVEDYGFSKAAPTTEHDYGFAGPSGQFLSRDEASKLVEDRLGRKPVTTLEPGEFHSDDLHDPRNALPPMAAVGHTPVTPADLTVGYWPAQATDYGLGTKGPSGRSGATFDDFNVHQMGREPIFDLPGGRNFVNQLSIDPAVSGPNRLMPGPTTLNEADYIRHQIPGFSDTELQGLRDLQKQGGLSGYDPKEATSLYAAASQGPLSAKQSTRLNELEGIKRQTDRLGYLEDIHTKTTGLADWLSRLPPEHADKGLPYFGNHALYDAYNRIAKVAESNVTTKGLYQTLVDVAAPASEAGPGARKLGDVIKGLGYAEAGEVTPGAKQTLLDMLGKKGKVPVGQAGTGGAWEDQFLNNLHVPADIADDLTRLKQGFTQPEALKPVLNAIDSFTSLFRMSQSAIWPSRYLRNLGQQVWGMFVGNHADPTANAAMKYLQPMMDAHTLFRTENGVIQGAKDIKFPGGRAFATDAEASRELAKEAFAFKVAGPEKLVREADVLGQGGMHAAQQNLQVPGAAQPTMGEIVSGGIPRSLEQADPRNIYGFGGRTDTKFAPARAGRQMDELIDDVTRGGSYISLRRQGYMPEAAMREVQKIHYDFGNLSPFERTVMKRTMPFYSWTRQNMPAVLQQLIETPGGKTGSAIKLSEAMRHDQGFVPDYVGEGLAVPIGKEDDGTQRFLSKFGLPFEDAFSDIGVGPNATQRTLQNVLSETNPLIKAPLELAAGKQFYSGRDLQDLSSKGLTGNTLIDQAIMNSPLSRFATSARTAFDERKGIGAKALNLLTPAKVTDVDLEKARSIAGRQLIEEQLKQNPNVQQFERLFVKPENLPNLNARDVELLRLYQTMQAQGKKVGVKKPGG